MQWLIDSVIFIDHFNGIAKASEFLDTQHKHCFISPITRAEVLAGFADKPAMIAKDLLDFFPVVPITKDEADLAARLRREHRWKLPDAFQAAIAVQHKLRLATRNSKDFDPQRHRFVHIPYKI